MSGKGEQALRKVHAIVRDTTLKNRCMSPEIYHRNCGNNRRHFCTGDCEVSLHDVSGNPGTYFSDDLCGIFHTTYLNMCLVALLELLSNSQTSSHRGGPGDRREKTVRYEIEIENKTRNHKTSGTRDACAS